MNSLADYARARRAAVMLPAEVLAVKKERVEEAKKKAAENPPVVLPPATITIGSESDQQTMIASDAPSTTVAVVSSLSSQPPRSITTELGQMRIRLPTPKSTVPLKTSFPSDGKKRKRVVAKGDTNKEKKKNSGVKASTVSGDVIFSGKNLPPKDLLLELSAADVSKAGAKENALVLLSTAAEGNALVPPADDVVEMALVSIEVVDEEPAATPTPTLGIVSPDLLPCSERLEGEGSDYFSAVNLALHLENESTPEDLPHMLEQDRSYERRLSKVEAILGVLMSDVTLMKSGYYLGGNAGEAPREQLRRGRRVDK